MPFGGENAESYYDEGLTAVMKGDVKRAIEFFMHAIKLDSSFIMAYHQLGRCFLRVGQTERAVHVLQQVLARKPNLIPARIDLGYALLQHGNVTEARVQFSQVVQVQAGSSKGHLGLAHVEFELGKDLKMEVELAVTTLESVPWKITAEVAGNQPAIRFTPDGFIGNNSPERIVIRQVHEGEEDEMWIGQSRNRLNYEIQTNALPTAQR